jgi:hypothetical protein
MDDVLPSGTRRGIKVIFNCHIHRLANRQQGECNCLAPQEGNKTGWKANQDDYRGHPGPGKLTATLSDEVTIDVNHLGDAFSFRRLGADAADADVFRRLARAVRDGRRGELVYWTASRDETLRRRVDPYHLASVNRDRYLVQQLLEGAGLLHDLLKATSAFQAMMQAGRGIKQPIRHEILAAVLLVAHEPLAEWFAKAVPDPAER